ncbi:hypothetical protein ACTJJ7_27355 [Phyllobacterium sp. 22229]|uniref:Uncharacterized protein n=1 Tax=Phyllobacterium myrsinacearum TaxID=28101 RepID=A0A2S9JFR2_9HYPH|nr:hypothetical protein [Phyllobacterium myrsinacearum]PRD51761.1 hypothetical protein C5750_18135 [Phyllobacterium myrsinacearum]PWV83601.1 hypothetical protein DEV92_1213 [Phyllobacterium myrsinacearum]RZS72766.1 hypothetical protein EV217_5237 [Phyllobacterium myrsinacearum]RZV00051.1 hypothetical protein EV654_4188 [Phyllobacterium myrsinacearum]
MEKYFIIGEAGTDELWLVNTAENRVEKLNSAAAGSVIETINTARKNGITLIKGVSIAIVTNSRTGADVKMSITDPTVK